MTEERYNQRQTTVNHNPINLGQTVMYYEYRHNGISEYIGMVTGNIGDLLTIHVFTDDEFKPVRIAEFVPHKNTHVLPNSEVNYCFWDYIPQTGILQNLGAKIHNQVTGKNVTQDGE
jgi:hypothetical protein